MSPYDPFRNFDEQEPYRSRRNVTCKRCGKEGLQWANEDGEWILVGRGGEIHKCPPAKPAEFEDIPT